METLEQSEAWGGGETGGNVHAEGESMRDIDTGRHAARVDNMKKKIYMNHRVEVVERCCMSLVSHRSPFMCSMNRFSCAVGSFRNHPQPLHFRGQQGGGGVYMGSV